MTIARIIHPALFALAFQGCNSSIQFDVVRQGETADSGPESLPLALDATVVDRAEPADAVSDGRVDGPYGSCTQDSDCHLSSLHCDTVSQTCVACVDDLNCAPELHRCDFALHVCVECGSQTDCAVGQTCGSTNHCITTCSSSASCPLETPTCDGRGLCVRCAQNADCTSLTAPLCNVTSGLCVACLKNKDCTAPSLSNCEPYRNVCVQCLSSSDCSGDHPICSPKSSSCVDD